MGLWNTAVKKTGTLMEGIGTWAQAEGKNLQRSMTSVDYSGIGNNIGQGWKAANSASAGFLTPTSIGMGVGGAVGGTVGAASDNGSFAGGFAGGAVLGGLGGAGFRSAQMGISKYKTGTYTNPENIAGKYSSWAPGASGYSSPVGRSGGSYHTSA